jgi:hypothetical protein
LVAHTWASLGYQLSKNKYCPRLTYEHLHAMLRISSSSFEADIHKLAGGIQPQKSHSADFKTHFMKV